MADFVQYFLLDPTALVFLSSALVLALLLYSGRAGRRGFRTSSTVLLVGAWLAICLMCGAPSVVNPLLTLLEDRYPETIECEPGSHLVMLGGGVDSRIASSNEFERMSSSTMARASAAARIAKREPELTMIAAGGAINTISEADVISAYWIAMGIEADRILLEGQSKNTRENALLFANLIESEPVRGQIRLVTSALHMPRALNTFRKALEQTDIEVCPVSVNREALKVMPLMAWIPQTTAQVKFNKWLHEIAALATYRLRGWI